MLRRRWLALAPFLACFGLALAALPVHGDTPRVFNFQGLLTAADGSLLDGSYDFRLTVCTSAPLPCDENQTNTVFRPIYREQHLAVDVVDGIYNVLLGSGDLREFESALNAELFDRPSAPWLEIEIRETGATPWEKLAPRVQLNGVPYALHAAEAETLVDPLTTEMLADDAVDASKLAPDAVTSSALADGAVRTEHIDDFSIDDTKLQALSVRTGALQFDAVTSAKLADGAVLEQHVRDDAIRTSALQDEAVTRFKIAPEAVWEDRLHPDVIDRLPLAWGWLFTAFGSDLVQFDATPNITIAIDADKVAFNITPPPACQNTGDCILLATPTNTQFAQWVSVKDEVGSDGHFAVITKGADGSNIGGFPGSGTGFSFLIMKLP